MKNKKHYYMLIDSHKSTIVFDDSIIKAVDFTQINIEDIHKHLTYKELFNTIKEFIRGVEND